MVTTTSTHPLTDEQLEILKFYSHSARHIAVSARAGSGKSFILKQAAISKGRTGGKVRMCTFNVHNKEHLERELASYHDVKIKTVHGWGKMLCHHNVPDLQTDLQKTGKIIREVQLPKGLRSSERYDFKRWVDMCKSNILLPETPNFDEVANFIKISYGLNVTFDGATDKLHSVLDLCLERTEVVDYSDMIYHPVALDYSAYKTAVIMVDEAQDLCPAKRKLTYKLGHRVVIVGDPLQSIMAFAGADCNSFPNYLKELSSISTIPAKELTLSTTFRCPASHVTLAQKLVPDFKGHKTEPGVISCGFKDDPPKDALVICRNTAPAVAYALSLLKRKIPAIVRGRDIAEFLLSFCDVEDYRHLDDMVGNADLKVRERLADLEKQEEDLFLDLSDQKNTLIDTLAVINNIAATCDNSVEHFARTVKTLFSDSTDPVVCSTIHRAKGLESTHVRILSPERLSIKSQQEKNCTYVAITRSKHELYFEDELPSFLQ